MNVVHYQNSSTEQVEQCKVVAELQSPWQLRLGRDPVSENLANLKHRTSKMNQIEMTCENLIIGNLGSIYISFVAYFTNAEYFSSFQTALQITQTFLSEKRSHLVQET
ncbi:hypothetical protein T09_7449 [Trichinella sp. T9]|nr:hypothetical protein T09_7449 [Trichinella sp. T9]KRZ97089.1 hypothetical protein T08_10141 [Trichinella sp. T8]